MKLHLIPFLTALLLAGSAAASDSITLQVDMKGLHKPHSGRDSTEEHHRWLEIKASAMALEQARKVTIEWRFFADDLAAGKVVEQSQGSESAEMQAGQTARLKTKDTVFAYVREHSERSGAGRRPVYKKVEASGTRYHGWAVRALIDGKVAGEAYSNRDIQDKMKEN